MTWTTQLVAQKTKNSLNKQRDITNYVPMEICGPMVDM